MNNLNAGTRIGTMLVDHFIMTFVITIFAMPGMVYDIFQTFTNLNSEPKLILGNIYVNIFAFSLYFNKDILLGRSPAKRLFKFQIIDYKTNRPANPIKCLFRNMTLILWPIEVIFGLINNERRVGDYIAGTKLTTYDPNLHKGNVNWILVVSAILISSLATYLVMFYPMELLFNFANTINK